MPVTLAKALAIAATAALTPAAYVAMGDRPSAPSVTPAPTVRIEGRLAYPEPGEFLRNGRPAEAPRRLLDLAPFDIMRSQVGATDYARCVLAGACKAGESPTVSAEALPATGISYLDALAYAQWYSGITGETWRLPTDAEWALAAAERFAGEDATADDPDNPARRWLEAYRTGAELRRGRTAELRPAGGFGTNANGIEDMAGSVWEWTSTCYVRATLSEDGGAVTSAVENCGVHVMEGRHRSYMSNFLRDGKSGGCAAGTPPDNLGFRLVRDASVPLAQRLRARLAALLQG